MARYWENGILLRPRSNSGSGIQKAEFRTPTEEIDYSFWALELGKKFRVCVFRMPKQSCLKKT
jgi:hypothetical protein